MSESTTEKGDAYERLVAALQKMLDPGAKVTWDRSIDGRQVDVAVEGTVGTASVLILIECRDYAEKIGVEAMEAWAEKKRKLGANKAIMVTSTGYTSGALDAATEAAIDACVLKKADDPDWEGYIRGFDLTVKMLVPVYGDIQIMNAAGEWIGPIGKKHDSG